jgi:hypothetical protein
MRRWSPRLAGCAALYGCSVGALLLSHLGSGWPFVDLAVYRSGGGAVLDGAHLYQLRFPGALAFTYPPFSALMFTGLTLVRMALLKTLVTAANVVMLPLMLGLAMRLRPLSTTLANERAMELAIVGAAAALWLEPVWTTLRYGQIDVLIGTLVLYDLSRADTRPWKGAGIGLAAGLKVTPAIFAAYLLLTRRYRAAAVSLTVFCATVVLGFLATPGDAREYWGGAFVDPGRVGRIENAANQALRGAYARLAHSVSVETAWVVSAVVVGVGGMALAARAGRRSDDAGGFCLCALTGLLVSPISWSHQWVLATAALMLFALGAYRRSSLAGVALAGLATLVFLSHMTWWVPVNRPLHSELHLDAPQLVVADAYVGMAMIALAVTGLAVALAGRGRTAAAAPMALRAGRRPPNPADVRKSWTAVQGRTR